jgi:hypothetical protein
MKSTTHTVVLLIRGIHAPSSTLKEIETDKELVCRQLAMSCICPVSSATLR